ncbi:Rho GTPase activation protein [Cyathus striatus]|nr:Rho GTPase activation protein [Cyathus striatus]
MFGETTINEITREFFVTQVELYLSNAAAAALRKPGAPNRKKLDKRDSSTALVEDGKLKERSSWLTLTKGLSGVGHWRNASCRLTEEDGRCLLNIYIEDSILYQTVYIHLLHQTDVRQVDDSLFFRKGCLGIYCINGQRWTCTHLNEPIYLRFPDIDSTRAWLALLRSFAVPEIYGRWFFPAEGGSYRMWRQIELKIIQGRNIGISRQYTDQFRQINEADSSPEPDVVDIDISCEVLLGDILYGRTTPKRGMGSPDWHEMFTFSDLPPFSNLDVIVWKEKKLFKPFILGSVRIPLTNFRRAESIEGWFPVVQSGAGLNDIQVGELRMKIRIDEEVILPSPVYSHLSEILRSRNFLDWILDLETELNLRSLSVQLMSLAIADDKLIEQVQEFASRDIRNTSSSYQTLFRGNTILTKVMELSMAWYGKAFLEASIGPVLRRLCADRVTIEVDPARSGKNGKGVERNVELLVCWCQEFWNQIYSVRSQCPQEMRRLFQTIRILVEERCSLDNTDLKHKDLPWQSVSAFCFLRFIVPAILNPHLFGLCSGLPSIPVQRSLKLIAKVIQSMANLNANTQKESFMASVKESLRNIRPAMLEYLLVVSTPTTNSSQLDDQIQERHAYLDIMAALRQRASKAPILEGESTPQLPHLLDISRQLATVASAIARHSADAAKRRRKENLVLKDLCAQCLEIEDQALFRVSQLASKLSSDDVPNEAVGFGNGPTTMVDESWRNLISTGSRSSHGNKGRSTTVPPVSEASVRLPSQASPSSLGSIKQNEDDMPPSDLTVELPLELRESAQIEISNDISDDAASRRRKGIFKGILRL